MHDRSSIEVSLYCGKKAARHTHWETPSMATELGMRTGHGSVPTVGEGVGDSLVVGVTLRVTLLVELRVADGVRDGVLDGETDGSAVALGATTQTPLSLIILMLGLKHTHAPAVAFHVPPTSPMLSHHWQDSTRPVRRLTTGAFPHVQVLLRMTGTHGDGEGLEDADAVDVEDAE